MCTVPGAFIIVLVGWIVELLITFLSKTPKNDIVDD
jgi:hypothetical protein